MQKLLVSHTVCSHGGPKNFGEAGAPSSRDVGVADPLVMCFSRLVLPCRIQSFSVKPFERSYGDLPLTPAFHGHSSSLELTWIDQPPVTSY